MARPKKNMEIEIENAFFDLDASTQGRLLRMLQRLHELRKRQKTEPTSEPPKMEPKSEPETLFTEAQQ